LFGGQSMSGKIAISRDQMFRERQHERGLMMDDGLINHSDLTGTRLSLNRARCYGFESAPAPSHFRSDGIGTGLQILVLTRFFSCEPAVAGRSRLWPAQADIHFARKTV
jgi:hypothetical protein